MSALAQTRRGLHLLRGWPAGAAPRRRLLTARALAAVLASLGLAVPAMAAGAPTPDAIPDLLLWLRAGAGVEGEGGGPAGAGAAVARWRDWSGRGHHAAQADPALRPRLAAAALEGRPAVRFDDAVQHLEAPLLDEASDYTFVMVLGGLEPERRDWTRLVSRYAGPGGSALDINQLALMYPLEIPVGEAGILQWDLGGGISAGAAYTTEPHVLTWRLADGADAASLYRGGARVGAGFGYARVDLPGITIGAQRHAGGVGQGFRGDLAELLVFARALTDAERRAVEGYLGAKYDLDPRPGARAPERGPHAKEEMRP